MRVLISMRLFLTLLVVLLFTTATIAAIGYVVLRHPPRAITGKVTQ